MRSMRADSPEARDLREALWILLICFGVGFICVGWSIFHFAWKPLAWWELLPLFAIGPVFGGLLFCTVGVLIQSVWHKWRGTYRCPQCNKANRNPWVPCKCGARP